MSFTGNISPEWIESQYILWKESPELLSPEWNAFFQGFELAEAYPSGREFLEPGPAFKLCGVQSLIFRFRSLGHLMACTDPLSPCRTDHPLLRMEEFDLDETDLDTVFRIRKFIKQEATLREILRIMRETYCRSIGVEFMHIQEPEEREWLIERMETVRNKPSFSTEAKLFILRKLQEAALFESFLHRKFLGQTRFSLEGGETLIPLLDTVVNHAGRLGVTDIILGTAHRGRFNIQANIFGRPFENIFAEFRDSGETGFIGDGDVKYHSSCSADLALPGGTRIHISMEPNPSHLESIDPVVEGKTRARQDRCGDAAKGVVMPVLIHGDAAFSGQGIVAETLNLSQLEGYGTGGTLHIVLNNQIGFTTPPSEARSTQYATDVAKMIMAPIFHVHGEDPEAVAHVAALAVEYRRKFARDAVIELICYRRHGHNEGDEPYFTQPLMYEKIRNRPPVHRLYADALAEEGTDIRLIGEMEREVTARLESAFEKQPVPKGAGFKGLWSAYQREYAPAKVETGVPGKTLKKLADTLAVMPADFTPHPKIVTLLKKRREAVEKGENIDWANAESLSFASLLGESVPVRLSGQDSRRGTFNQRHCVLIDIRTEKEFVPYDSVAARGTAFRPFDSMLSEEGVLGFEYGYSEEAPEALTIWEAQYGDFANGAQVIIDQFIASGVTKWSRGCGLVMLLPHGYEGQGAEHTSARIERYLQLCGENNIQVVFPSTPAQYFHLLRRQVKQPFRIPLVVFTPKSLLRHPLCVSRLDEFTDGWFQEILPGAEDPEKINVVLICSGKIFFELLERKMKEGREDMAIIRVEQLYPLRADLLRAEISRYRKAGSFSWVQEEPRNMGAWMFIRPYLAEILGRDPAYIGRKEDATPAVGSHRQHKIEQARIVEEVFGLRPG
ncbi:MAG TPA: 2-oxoglutarate dehydrogenase E1 component [Geobacteraceae bacterium]|nr:2-oxoglutarate dehydrogenase E1 component [Geobacteraceae bacterium]